MIISVKINTKKTKLLLSIPIVSIIICISVFASGMIRRTLLSSQKDNKRNTLCTENYIGVDYIIIVHLMYNDSVYECCSHASKIFIEFNIDSEEIADKFYQKYIKDDKPIPISEVQYSRFENDIIYESAYIKQVYMEHGVKYLLSSYGNKETITTMYLQDYESFKYLSYIFWQNGIYMNTEDESGPYCWILSGNI